tara:strand:+ start:69003 stop:70013 length:1011 start_codon:yes stop_codon:yes gene_type:complete
MANVSLKEISKSYGNGKKAVEVIKNLDLEIADKEFLVLVGPSGCGKSTLLRMIAGLEDITKGKIAIDDKLVNNLEPRDRNIAMVFQNYALYPHMDVEKNIGFGLRARNLPKADIAAKVKEAAEMLEISDLLHRKPAELSGGQRQRVAMGRAIVRDPAVFLFDEPLSNLDAKLRASMRAEIKKLHAAVKTTMIYVTHDQVEAMTLADRIVIMRDGLIQQIGTPMDLYSTPANKFVASFIGSPEMNFMTSKEGVALGIRPEDIYLEADGEGLEKARKIRAVVEVVEPLGAETLLTASYDGTKIVAKLNGTVELEAGAEVKLVLDMRHAHLFGVEGERV